MRIKAIETVYKGYRFRSRLEARWAVVFDALKLDWEYEPEGFVLPDGTWYLPDFYMRDEGWFVEVKADRPLTEAEKNKVRQLDNVIIDTDDYKSWGCLVTPKLKMFGKSPLTKDFWPEDQPQKIFFQLIMPLNENWNYKTANKAILKGQQARFEHGETPL